MFCVAFQISFSSKASHDVIPAEFLFFTFRLYKIQQRTTELTRNKMYISIKKISQNMERWISCFTSHSAHWNPILTVYLNLQIHFTWRLTSVVIVQWLQLGRNLEGSSGLRTRQKRTMFPSSLPFCLICSSRGRKHRCKLSTSWSFPQQEQN